MITYGPSISTINSQHVLYNMDECVCVCVMFWGKIEKQFGILFNF